MKLDPRHLEILAAIVEQGGLTEGAAALGKSQPSVSRSLALLEGRVGAPLFEPRRRPLQPTELGASLAREGKKILEAGQIASRVCDNFSKGVAGRIRVAGTPIFMDGVISSLIASFQTDHPNITLDQSYAYQSEALDLIARDLLDLAILPVRPEDLPESYSFNLLLRGKNVVACRPGHPLAGLPEATIEHLVDYPWIVPPANSPLSQDLRAILDKSENRELKIGFTGGSLSAVVNVLLGSDSLTVLPYSVVLMQQQQNRMVVLPIKIGDPDRHLGVVTLRARELSASAERFAAFLHKRFDEIQQRLSRP